MSLRVTDPILFQVLSSSFTSIVDEMGALMQRVAFSLVVSEGRDYCGTICTREGDLVTSGTTDLPAHLGTHPFTVRGMLDWVGKEPEEFLVPGDVMIMNDAYIGGTHNHDVRVILPVFFDGRIVAFVVNSSHWTDVGGHVPGTFDPNARSSHGEGLIIPPCHIVSGGRLNDELVGLILRNVRVPEATHGDLLAQIGAVRLAERRLQELRDHYGENVVLGAMREVIEYSETLLRKEFARLEDGSWDAEAFVDGDPAVPGGPPVGLRMTLEIDGGTAVYDFRESDPQAKGAINAPISCTVSAALVATKAIFPHVPMNQGVFNAITFRFPDEPSVVNAAYPAPISGMAAAVFPGIVNCVLWTFAHLVPERCMAGPTGLTNITWGGFDERPGQRPGICLLPLARGRLGRSSGPARQPHGHDAVRDERDQPARGAPRAKCAARVRVLPSRARFGRPGGVSRQQRRDAPLARESRRCCALVPRQRPALRSVGLCRREGRATEPLRVRARRRRRAS